MNEAIAWYRSRVARLERQVGEWMAIAGRMEQERDDARTALAHMHTTCMEQQAEIARLQAVERSAWRVDL